MNKKDWTAIIPAAGTGSRLGFNKPKLLYPICGRTILDRIVSLLEPWCRDFIFVIRPDDWAVLTPEFEILRRSRRLAIRHCVQKRGAGTAVAVRYARDLVKTNNTLIMWGDHPTVASLTITNAMAKHCEITVPTIVVDNPYVAFIREGLVGKVYNILESRDGQSMQARGESDVGMFLFKTAILKSETLVSPATKLQSGEYSFLKALLRMANHYPVVCTSVRNEIETVGVNTLEDVKRIEESGCFQV